MLLRHEVWLRFADVSDVLAASNIRAISLPKEGLRISEPCVDWPPHRGLRSEISGSHGGEYEDDSLLGCCAVKYLNFKKCDNFISHFIESCDHV
jgi:hypothetical protein